MLQVRSKLAGLVVASQLMAPREHEPLPADFLLGNFPARAAAQEPPSPEQQRAKNLEALKQCLNNLDTAGLKPEPIKAKDGSVRVFGTEKEQFTVSQVRYPQVFGTGETVNHEIFMLAYRLYDVDSGDRRGRILRLASAQDWRQTAETENVTPAEFETIARVIAAVHAQKERLLVAGIDDDALYVMSRTSADKDPTGSPRSQLRRVPRSKLSDTGEKVIRELSSTKDALYFTDGTEMPPKRTKEVIKSDVLLNFKGKDEDSGLALQVTSHEVRGDEGLKTLLHVIVTRDGKEQVTRLKTVSFLGQPVKGRITGERARERQEAATGTIGHIRNVLDDASKRQRIGARLVTDSIEPPAFTVHVGKDQRFCVLLTRASMLTLTEGENAHSDPIFIGRLMVADKPLTEREPTTPNELKDWVYLMLTLEENGLVPSSARKTKDGLEIALGEKKILIPAASFGKALPPNSTDQPAGIVTILNAELKKK